MATDTIRTLLAHAFPGADSALDDRTGGGHFQVAALSSAFDGTWLGLRLNREWLIHKRSEQAPQRCCERWGKDGLLKAATGSGSLCALARFAHDGFSCVAQTR